MPTVLHESQGHSADAASDLIHPETGELTLETQVLADFLTHVDLSAVCEVEGVEAACFEAEIENDEGVLEKVQLVPGDVVADLVDEDDLQAMFVHYINQLAESVMGNKDSTLEEKARLAPFTELIEGPHRRGDFARMHKKPAGHHKAARQMVAMLRKGVIKHVKKGTGQGKGKDYRRDKGYKSGGTPQGKKLYARFKAKSGAKLKKAAVRAKQKFKAESFDADSTPIWGLGIPIDSASYEASVREDAQARVEEAKKKLPPWMMKGAKKNDDDKDDDEEETDESKKAPVQQVAAGRTVLEGAGLAGQILPLMEARSGVPAK